MNRTTGAFFWEYVPTLTAVGMHLAFNSTRVSACFLKLESSEGYPAYESAVFSILLLQVTPKLLKPAFKSFTDLSKPTLTAPAPTILQPTPFLIPTLLQWESDTSGRTSPSSSTTSRASFKSSPSTLQSFSNRSSSHTRRSTPSLPGSSFLAPGRLTPPTTRASSPVPRTVGASCSGASRRHRRSGMCVLW